MLPLIDQCCISLFVMMFAAIVYFAISAPESTTTKKQGRFQVVSIDTSENVLSSNHHSMAHRPCVTERGVLGHGLSAPAGPEITTKNVEISSSLVKDDNDSQHVPYFDIAIV